MITAQQRIERDALSLESILRDHPEVRRYVEQAYRRGYSHGVYNYRDNLERVTSHLQSPNGAMSFTTGDTNNPARKRRAIWAIGLCRRYLLRQ